MKKSKLIVLWGLTFLAGIVVGMAGASLYRQQAVRGESSASCLAQGDREPLHLAQLEDATLLDDVREVLPDHSPKSAADLPSQLVRTELPEDMRLSSASAVQPADEVPTSGIVLTDKQNTVVLNAQQPAQRAADNATGITKIEAPVALKRIQSLDEYKSFKRQARGSYPEANFATEEVLVLESTSNLPDKVFEIVDMVPGKDQLTLIYRVNIFGLDEKTNTHTARKIKKTALPIQLEQVL